MNEILASYQEIFFASIPVYLFITGGYLFRKWGWLTKTADESLIRLQIRVFYPALILSFIYGNEALKDGVLVFQAPAIGFGSILVGLVIASVVAKLFRFQEGSGKRTFIFTTSIYNYGFIAIPLSQSLFNDSAVTGTLVVFNAGVEIAIWSIGIVVLSGGLQRKSLKTLFNPPLIAVVVALVLNHAVSPSELSDDFAGRIFNTMIHTASWLGAGAIPFALILIGASVRDLLDGRELSRDWKILSSATITRMIIIPVSFLVIASFLPIPAALKAVLVVQAAMPSGMFPIILARQYGGKPAIAAQIVIATTLISLVTIPIWIIIGRIATGLD